ncbi:formate/nitrite transporter family protein [Candidatus Saccharibacteria bacterium]|nr:formate/nitrite transporter family protein [Candidatus Saccharibacteria bacterium]
MKRGQKKSSKLGVFLYAVLAGISISLGGTVFLRLKDAFPGGNVAGALLFTIGLFVICTRGYNLFTGKACYIPDNKPKYLITLAIIWLGNLLGCMLIAGLERLTGICGTNGINETAETLVGAKMSASLFSLFILGFLCNIFIFIAVDGFKNNKHELGKYLALFLGVSIFILCGTEHSVADMYYWSVSGMLFANFGSSILRIIIISLGNVLGGITFPLIEKAKNKLDKN